MKTILKILSNVRFVVCLFIIMVIGLITLPITLFSKWDGFWVLCVANEEGCSLSEARKIIQEGKRYKSTNVTLRESQNLLPKVSSAIGEDEINSPAYKHLPFNIHHRY